MKKNVTLIIACVTLLAACKKNNPKEDVMSPMNTTEKIHLCIDKSERQSATEKTNGSIFTSKKWANGQTLRIKFLNGSSFLQNKVIQYAAEWLPYINLDFKYIYSNEAADIRINFDESGSTYSRVGTGSNEIPQSQHSMNFGWFTNSTSETEFRRVIVHEFGHALGLIHEHQSPAATIPWDREKVYTIYAAAPNFWDRQKVDENILGRYSSSVTNYTSFDAQSIMLYPIPAELTTNGYSVGWNDALSATDKAFISQQYPPMNILSAGQGLQQNQFLKSLDKRFKLTLHTNGSLVMVKDGETAVWSTPIYGPNITHLEMQNDGNLVLYDNYATPYWNTGTQGNYGSYLALQNDGNLVIYRNNVPVWYTGHHDYNYSSNGPYIPAESDKP